MDDDFAEEGREVFGRRDSQWDRAVELRKGLLCRVTEAALEQSRIVFGRIESRPNDAADPGPLPGVGCGCQVGDNLLDRLVCTLSGERPLLGFECGEQIGQARAFRVNEVPVFGFVHLFVPCDSSPETLTRPSSSKSNSNRKRSQTTGISGANPR